MRNLILHVGTRKTGTTSIQRSLASSKIYLEKNKIFFLGPNLGYRLYPLFLEEPRNSYYFKVNKIDTVRKEKEELKKYKDKIEDRLNSIEKGTVIISEEDLLLISKSKVKDLKEFLDRYFDNIKVVIYVREPYSYLKSHLLQDIKVGTKSFDQLSPEQYPSFVPIIKEYMEYFDKKNFIIRPFDKKNLINGDLISDFIISSGLKDINLDMITKTNSNKSLGKNSLLLLSETNRKYPLFLNGKRNPNRGKGDYLRILDKLEDSKVDFEMPFSKDRIDEVNKEIDFYNNLFADNFKFEKLKNTEGKKIYPNDKFLPVDYVVDLFNEYNKYVDNLLEKITVMERKLYKQITDRGENGKQGRLDHVFFKFKRSFFGNKNNVESSGNISMQQRKKKNLSETTNSYSCRFESLKHISPVKDIKECFVDGKKLYLVASGKDPVISVGDFGWKQEINSTMWMKIKITAPAPTELELFYAIEFETDGKYPFAEENKVMYPLRKGENEIYLYIEAPSRINKLRLDPGKVEGQYIIHEFEVRL